MKNIKEVLKAINIEVEWLHKNGVIKDNKQVLLALTEALKQAIKAA